MNLIDFHCHLDAEEYNENRISIIKECFNNGFKAIVQVADPYKDTSVLATETLLNADNRIYGMIGAHPHQADQYNHQIEQKIIYFHKKWNAIGLGEVGLDYYYQFSSRENQTQVFCRQIALAHELQSPLIIHSRSAEADVLRLLQQHKFDQPVIFHCYSGSLPHALEIIKRGYYLSFSGIITFKKADEIREIATLVPLDHIFCETDSPYLAPVPYRGQTNSPAHVKMVVETLAKLKNSTFETITQAIWNNFKTLFQLKQK
jgi:TatD DNase family protein